MVATSTAISPRQLRKEQKLWGRRIVVTATLRFLIRLG
jgi:hypothetical protein